MSRPLHRHRKFLTASALGFWIFALFVGIANACSWDGVTAVPHHLTVVAHAIDDIADQDIAPGCDVFCSNDVPMLSVLKLVQDQPAGQPLVLATHHCLGVRSSAAPILRLAQTTHPPPGVPFSLRIVRLAL